MFGINGVFLSLLLPIPHDRPCSSPARLATLSLSQSLNVLFPAPRANASIRGWIFTTNYPNLSLPLHIERASWGRRRVRLSICSFRVDFFSRMIHPLSIYFLPFKSETSLLFPNDSPSTLNKITMSWDRRSNYPVCISLFFDNFRG